MIVLEKKAEYIKKITCPYCKAKLGLQLNDFKGYNRSYYDGSTDFIHYVVCANCTEEITLEAGQVPESKRYVVSK